MVLKVLPGDYTIHRMGPDRKLPEISSGFLSITPTDDEISVVCRDKHIRFIH